MQRQPLEKSRGPGHTAPQAGAPGQAEGPRHTACPSACTPTLWGTSTPSPPLGRQQAPGSTEPSPLSAQEMGTCLAREGAH